MKNNFVEESTLIGDLVDQYPETIDLLQAMGMHCLGCPASREESLKDACRVHDIQASLMVEALNVQIAEGRKEK